MTESNQLFNSKKINILMLIPQLSMGGAERSFSKVANALSKFHNLAVVVFDDKNVHFKLDCDVISLNVTAGKSVPEKVIRFYERLERLKEIARSKQTDVIISYLEGANYLNVLMPSQYKKIISQRGSVFNDETMKGFVRWFRINVLIKWLYRRSDRMVVLNQEIKEELLQLLPSSNAISVIPNMFPISELSRLSKEQPEESFLRDNRRKVCVTGRLASEKGYHHILQVLRLVNSSNDHKIALYIIGEGSQQEFLEELAQNLGLTIGFANNSDYSKFDVIFLGRKSNPFMYIRNSELLLITSSSEGGPNILVESMICNTLVASVNCPSGPRRHISPSMLVPYDLQEFFIGRNGLLLPHFQNINVKKVYSIWADFLNSPIETALKDQLILNAKNYSNDFTTERVIKKWLRQIEMCYS